MERKISSKPVDTTKLSPMMRQYWSVKEKYLDQLLFFRLGDFYELFFDDALIASRELELTLTGKECGLEERAPMCGIPYHSSESYIAKLVKKAIKWQFVNRWRILQQQRVWSNERSSVWLLQNGTGN